MGKTKKTPKKTTAKASAKKATKPVAKKKATKAKVAGRRGPRVLKVYELVKPIPESVGKKTTAYAMLKSIEKHAGKATGAMIYADIGGSKVPTPTLRFYLGKFQREKLVKSKKSKA